MENPDIQDAVETPTITPTQWSKPARAIVAVIALVSLLGLIVFLIPIARSLLAALLFAIILDIPIRYIVRRMSLSYPQTAIVIYGVIYVVLALLLLLGWRFMVNYLQEMVTNLSQAASALLTRLQGAESSSTMNSLSVVGVFNDTLAKILSLMVRTLFGMLSFPITAYLRFAIVVVNIGFFIFLSNLLIFSGYGARGQLRKWIPSILDREVTLLTTFFDRIWGNYLAGMAFFVILLGAGSIVEFWLLGVPYPVVMGILTGLICLIPLIGGFLSGLIVFIPCLLLGSARFTTLDPLVFALIVTLVNDIICTVAYNFGALPVIGKLVRLPYWVTLAGVMLGFAFNNILLAFLIIPLFSTIRIVYTYFLAKIIGVEPFPGFEKPAGPATGYLSQFVLDEPQPARKPRLKRLQSSAMKEE